MWFHLWLGRLRLVLSVGAVVAVCAGPIACASSLGSDLGGQPCNKGRGMPECR
jgi:hypothetical protein